MPDGIDVGAIGCLGAALEHRRARDQHVGPGGDDLWRRLRCDAAVDLDIDRPAGHQSAHLRHLNPFPSNLGEVLSNFETVLIPEMNLGQLCTMIRARFLIDAVPFSKVKGRPFQIREIVRKVEEYL